MNHSHRAVVVLDHVGEEEPVVLDAVCAGEIEKLLRRQHARHLHVRHVHVGHLHPRVRGHLSARVDLRNRPVPLTEPALHHSNFVFLSVRDPGG